TRHGRACPGHPRLHAAQFEKTWMPATSAGMTYREAVMHQGPPPSRRPGMTGRADFYLPSFQISAASFHWPRKRSHTTRYFPEISFGDAPLVVRLKVPISRAAAGPSRLTSSVVILGLPACSARPFHIAPMAPFPRTIAAPGGNATASAV